VVQGKDAEPGTQSTRGGREQIGSPVDVTGGGPPAGPQAHRLDFCCLGPMPYRLSRYDLECRGHRTSNGVGNRGVLFRPLDQRA
jgi:hypothetical protein